MNYALRDYESHLIQATVRLANSRRQRVSAEDVDAQMAVSAFLTLCDFEANVDDLLLPVARSMCLEYRDQLRDWFERITKANNQRREVAQEVNSIIWDAVKLNLRLSENEKKSFRYIETQFGPKTVLGALALATALILDESYGLTNRLKQCGNPECGKFNLDVKPQGRPRTHCNDTCKKAADAKTSAKRSKDWRDKNKRKQKRR